MGPEAPRAPQRPREDAGAPTAGASRLPGPRVRYRSRGAPCGAEANGARLDGVVLRASGEPTRGFELRRSVLRGFNRWVSGVLSRPMILVVAVLGASGPEETGRGAKGHRKAKEAFSLPQRDRQGEQPPRQCIGHQSPESRVPGRVPSIKGRRPPPRPRPTRHDAPAPCRLAALPPTESPGPRADPAPFRRGSRPPGAKPAPEATGVDRGARPLWGWSLLSCVTDLWVP